ncbi:hypothetical protein E2562_028142 [Oryza meyeriana var. granulata]|uniref:Uncharacterized protein n=1 Tax=Oryza meyeriana var. granulata TaxID=110450 RepID=A0A6G1D7G6_9ORYZ|nr:hypothetical protein E2562_028142 [Oryza meyeriana var. granulata]
MELWPEGGTKAGGIGKSADQPWKAAAAATRRGCGSYPSQRCRTPVDNGEEGCRWWDSEDRSPERSQDGRLRHEIQEAARPRGHWRRRCWCRSTTKPEVREDVDDGCSSP